MSAPSLYVLPASKAEYAWDPEVRRFARKTRLFDANGTEFVGLTEVSVSDDPHDPNLRLITVTMRLARDDIQTIDAPPGA